MEALESKSPGLLFIFLVSLLKTADKRHTGGIENE